MIYRMLRVIYHALSGCFVFANAIFTKLGIGLTAAICVMVLVSSVLRLFTARFIGSQIVQADERIKGAETAQRAASYETYAAKRDRGRAYEKRYRKERGLPAKPAKYQ